MLEWLSDCVELTGGEIEFLSIRQHKVPGRSDFRHSGASKLESCNSCRKAGLFKKFNTAE